MPRITEDLVRRRAEHNDCDITTLEELSLHQQEIERIEHLDRWCRDLKILYLQNNLIPKIENVGRLKQLEYLNVALNNIERIENLGGCEFLQKLDLTVNFVGDLLSVESLQANHHFRELYLTGNPCTDYEGYREFVIATLPRLQWLDGKEVSKSERIVATQRYHELRGEILQQQKTYQARREREKREHMEREAEKGRRKGSRPGFDGRWYTDSNSHLQHRAREEGEERETEKPADEDDEKDEKFWNETTTYTPESRTEVHQYMAEKRKEKAKSTDIKGLETHKRAVRLERDGKMLNINEGRYDFNLREEDENNQYLLEVAIPRYMDTSLVDCDIQPTYVRLRIKGKTLQLVLGEEVSPDRSSAQRSQTTGHLLVTLPKAREMVNTARSKPQPEKPSSSHPQSATSHRSSQSEPASSEPVNIRNIVARREEEEDGCGQFRETEKSSNRPLIQELEHTSSCRDDHKGVESTLGDEGCSDEDSDVPPLI